jgi:hypothetical protein
LEVRANAVKSAVWLTDGNLSDSIKQQAGQLNWNSAELEFRTDWPRREVVGLDDRNSKKADL